MWVCSGNHTGLEAARFGLARQHVGADGVVGGKHLDAEEHGVPATPVSPAGQGDDCGEMRAAHAPPQRRSRIQRTTAIVTATASVAIGMPSWSEPGRGS